MPFVMQERPDGRINVVNPITGDVKGTHKNKRQALAQMRALYANVPDAMQKRRNNEPTNPQLWMQAKNQAKRRFTVYPSAYANAWAARWYKEHGGGWKEASPPPTETRDPRSVQKDLREWFKEDWVDISKPIRENGKIVGYEQCGRAEAEASEGGYPKCLPKAKAMKLSEMDRLKLIARKRRAGTPTDGKPIMTSSMTKKAATAKALLQKMQRMYIPEEWVDITKPIRDNAGLIVGFQDVTYKKEAKFPMRRQQAVKMTEQERQALIRNRFGHMLTDDGVPVASKKEKTMKKYGRYKRQ
jgi:hypothetical protein